MIPEYTYVQKAFKKHQGYSLNLENPKTLNEKINWLKLYDRREIHTKLADKYKVREYISELIGDEYLIPLILETKDINEIRPENLPNFPFIIKANHDSSGGIIVRDKSKMNWENVRKELKRRLKVNYYDRSKEWQYKNIEKRIIVEKLLIDSDGGIPMDYKNHLINGKVQMIQVDAGRDSLSHYRNWYNSNWEEIPFKWNATIKGRDKISDSSNFEIEKPSTLTKMVELSEKLAKGFNYLRVDWYDVNGSLYFGEITFHHNSGLSPITPIEWDHKLGEMIELKNTFDN